MSSLMKGSSISWADYCVWNQIKEYLQKMLITIPILNKNLEHALQMTYQFQKKIYMGILAQTMLKILQITKRNY